MLALAALVGLFVLFAAQFWSPWGLHNLEQLKYSIVKKQAKINLNVGRINNFFGTKSIYIFDKKEDILKGIL